MKKLLCIAVIAVFSTLSAEAQFIKLGAKGGVNFANLVGKDVENSDIRTSFHIGGMVEFKLYDKFSFQPELIYSAQGAQSEIQEGGVNLTSRLKLNYLNLPLMGKFYVTEGLSLQLGPQIGFLLDGELELESGDNTIEADVKDLYKEIDFGVNFGLGYQLDSGLFFDARYNLGLSKVLDEEDEQNESKVRNGVIQVSVGFSF